LRSDYSIFMTAENPKITHEIDLNYPETIVFLDGDHTLWTVTKDGQYSDDYVSSLTKIGIDPGYTQRDENTVVRSDGVVFTLKAGVREFLQYIHKDGFAVGIISDNIRSDVDALCNLFGIDLYFDKRFVSVILWEGTADKAGMIQSVLDKVKNTSTQQFTPRVIMVDDSVKRYQQQITDAGFEFIPSPKDCFPQVEIINCADSK
jgi:magnesium-dependent phosphatase-1